MSTNYRLINNKYLIQQQIGYGGMAYVYLAKDLTLNRIVALKIIRKEAFPPKDYEHLRKRFEIEARTMARLDHPNIVKIYDYGMYGGSPFLVMEYIGGGTLKQQMRHPYPYNQAAMILAPIAAGLSYAHNQNILHRDVKPANILIRNDGTPVLTDFGIAKMLETNGREHTLTETGMGVGTPDYMSPEQCTEKNIDGRADEYSLGMIFFEMCTGRKPYSGKTPTDIMLKQVSAEVPKLSDFLVKVPPRLSEVINKVLAKNPDDRYPSCKVFSEKLLNLSRDKNVPMPVLRYQTNEAATGSNDKTIDVEVQNNSGQNNLQIQPKKKIKHWYKIALILSIFVALSGIIYFGILSKADVFQTGNTTTYSNLSQNANSAISDGNPIPGENETTEVKHLFPTVTNAIDNADTPDREELILETQLAEIQTEPVSVEQNLSTVTPSPRPTATETPRPVTAERANLFIDNITQFYIHNDTGRNDSFQSPVMVKETSIDNFSSRALAQRNGVEKNAVLSQGDIVTYTGKSKHYGNDLMLLVKTSSNITGYVYSGYLSIVETSLSDNNGNTVAICASDNAGEPGNIVIQPGNLIRYGNYNEIPLLWQIVKIDENNNALLVSQYLIAQLPYNSGQGFNTTWANCSLRSWLNNSFLNSAFSDDEQNNLLPNVNGLQEDKVTLLSKSDITGREISFGEEIYSPCWLIDGMLTSTDRAYFFDNGIFDETYHETVTVRLGVRPVIRINLDSIQ